MVHRLNRWRCIQPHWRPGLLYLLLSLFLLTRVDGGVQSTNDPYGCIGESSGTCPRAATVYFEVTWFSSDLVTSDLGFVQYAIATFPEFDGRLSFLLADAGQESQTMHFKITPPEVTDTTSQTAIELSTTMQTFLEDPLYDLTPFNIDASCGSIWTITDVAYCSSDSSWRSTNSPTRQCPRRCNDLATFKIQDTYPTTDPCPIDMAAASTCNAPDACAETGVVELIFYFDTNQAPLILSLAGYAQLFSSWWGGNNNRYIITKSADSFQLTVAIGPCLSDCAGTPTSSLSAGAIGTKLLNNFKVTHIDNQMRSSPFMSTLLVSSYPQMLLYTCDAPVGAIGVSCDLCSDGVTFRTSATVCPITWSTSANSCTPSSTPSCALVVVVSFDLTFTPNDDGVDPDLDPVAIIAAFDTLTGTSSRFSITDISPQGTSRSASISISADSTNSAFVLTQQIQTAFMDTSSALRTASAMAQLVTDDYPVFTGSAVICSSDGSYAADLYHCPVQCADASWVTLPARCPITYDASSTCTPSTTPSCATVATWSIKMLFNERASDMNPGTLQDAVANYLTTIDPSRITVSNALGPSITQAYVTVKITSDSLTSTFDLASDFVAQLYDSSSTLRTYDGGAGAGNEAFKSFDPLTWPTFYGSAYLCSYTGEYVTESSACLELCSSDLTAYAIDDDHCPLKCADNTLIDQTTSSCPLTYLPASTCTPASTSTTCAPSASVAIKLTFKDEVGNRVTSAITTALIAHVNSIAGYESVPSSRVDSVTNIAVDASTSTSTVVLSGGAFPTAFDLASLIYTAVYDETSPLRTSGPFAKLNILVLPTFQATANVCPEDSNEYYLSSTALCPLLCADGSYSTPPAVCATVWIPASSIYCTPNTVPSCASVVVANFTFSFTDDATPLVASNIIAALDAQTSTSGRFAIMALDTTGSSRKAVIQISAGSSTTAFQLATLVQTGFKNSASALRTATGMSMLQVANYPIFTGLASICANGVYSNPCPIQCSSDLSYAVDQYHCPVLCTDGSWKTLPTLCPVTYSASSTCTPSMTNPTCTSVGGASIKMAFNVSQASLTGTKVIAAIASFLGINIDRVSFTSSVGSTSNDCFATITISGNRTLTPVFTLINTFHTGFYDTTSALHLYTYFSDILPVFNYVNPLILPVYTGSAYLCTTGAYAETVDTCDHPTYSSSYCFLFCAAGEGYGMKDILDTNTLQWSQNVTCTPCSPGKYSGGYISTCLPCPVGRATNETGQSACALCSVGTVASTTGLTGCVSCSTGTYSIGLGGSTCQACGIGRYAPTTGLSACLSCGLGTAASVTGLSGCIGCGLGTFAGTTGLAVCTSCLVGTQASVTGLTACTACLKGYYASSSGLANCLPCGLGQYAASTGTVTCSSCAAGTYTAATGLSGCTACVTGRYTSSVGTSGCIRCSRGTIASVTGASVCTSCNAGFYSSGADDATASVCTPCAIGSYAASSGMSACTACGLGYVAGDTGMSICDICQSGSYTAATGTTGCTQCDSDTYQSQAGQSGCIACDAGYTAEIGSVSCTTSTCDSGTYKNYYTCTINHHSYTGCYTCSNCPAGTYVSSSTGCSDCAAGTYSYAGSTLSQCYQCDLGTYSLAGATGCTACTVGTAAPSKGSSGCTTCTPGKFSHLSHSIACLDCPIGRFSANTASIQTFQCTACSAGTFTSSAGLSGCTNCPAGKFNSFSGAASCDLCGTGTITAATGLTVCSACLSGTYASTSGLSFCSACAIGTYMDVSGAIGCIPCSLGKYTSTTGLAVCTSCLAGTYGTGITTAGGPFCSACPNGRYAEQSGMSACTVCPAGAYSDPTSGLATDGCTPCPIGKIAATTGSTICSSCTDGKYAAVIGSSACVNCPSGSYSNSGTGYSTLDCTPCGLGTVQPSTGQAGCSTCTDGKYAASTGLRVCVSCAAGYYSNIAVGYSSCTPCATGSYSSGQAASCTACDTGKFAASTGMSACLECAAGSFAAATGMSGCSSCTAGKAQPSTGQASCPDCIDGKYAVGNGNQICGPCDPGKFTDSTTGHSICSPCAKGFYQSLAGSSGCLPCEKGSYSVSQSALSCTVCEAGRYAATTGMSGCTSCDSGTVALTGQSACVRCIAGTYASTTGMSICKACAVGSFNTGVSDLDASGCIACGPGYFADTCTGAPTCSPCPVGRYSAVSGVSICTHCESGRFIATTGATGCTLCLKGTAQPDVEQSSCIACDIGRYAASSGYVNCQPCSEGSFAATTGLSGCISCDPGSYQDHAGNHTCIECPAGRYTSDLGALVCTACEGGSFSVGTGNTGCTSCDAGTYRPESGATGCTSCAKGTWSNSSALLCTSCERGTYAADLGSTSCTDCDPSFYQENSGASACVSCLLPYTSSYATSICKKCPSGRYEGIDHVCADCTAGRYADESGLTECKLCEPGKVQPTEAQASCSSCAKGFFTNTSGNTECDPCIVGTFALDPGSSKCTECSPGKFALVQSSTTCLSCDAGKYSATNRTVNCLLCEPGKSQSKEGQSFCDLCVPGKFATISGLSTCENCKAGFIAPGNATELCDGCVAGKYQAAQGESQCVSCNPGYTSGAEAKICDPCPAGSFVNYTSGIGVCQLCAAGRYQSQPGSVECIDCDTGKYASEPGKVVCTPCLAAYFAPTNGTISCIPCTAGKSQKSEGKSVCENCPPGSISADKAEGCTACLAGTYHNVSENTCISCPAGRSQPATSQTVCPPCDGGSTSAEGAKTCTPCAKGSFLNATFEVGFCQSCAPGSFASEEGQVNCTLCEVGKSQKLSGTSTCSDCDSGTFADTEGATTCSPCTPGRYQTFAGRTLCLPCDAGSTSDEGAKVCTDCIVGTYHRVGENVCVNCPPGRIQTTKGQTECPLCPLGTISNEKESSACTPCAAGTYQNATLNLCLDCPAGKYQSSDLGGPTATFCLSCATGSVSSKKSSECTACPSGTFASNSIGVPVCEPCSAGRYQGSTGQTSCLSCDAGSTSEENAKVCTLCIVGTYHRVFENVCVNCPAGRIQTTKGQTDCVDCPSGSVAGGGTSFCSQCLAGSYANVTTCQSCPTGKHSTDGQTSCDSCIIGEYLDSSGKCANCAIGSFGRVSSDGLNECVQCAAGTFSSAPGQTVCQDCPSGSYNSFAAQSKCNDCLGGTYANVNRTGCVACSAGTTSSAGQTVCVDCEPGYYTKDDGRSTCAACDSGTYSNVPGSTICFNCPPGANCTSSGTSIVSNGPQVGYWARTTNGKLALDELEFYKCPSTEACLGGNASACAIGYTGPVCALCQDGYFSRAGTCYECQGVNVGVGIAVAIGGVLVLGLGLRMAYMHKGVRSVTPGGLIKLIVGFMQVMQVVAANYKIPFPPLLAQAMVVGRLLLLQVLQITSFGCVANVTFYNSLVIIAVLPVGICLILFGVYFALPSLSTVKRTETNHFGLKVKPLPPQPPAKLEPEFLEDGVTPNPKSGEPIPVEAEIPTECLPFDQRTPEQSRDLLAASIKEEQKMIAHRRNFLIKLIFLFITVVYPGISIVVFQTFVCRNINGVDYLEADYSLQCYTREHYSWLLVSGFIILLVPVGVPAGIGLFLKYRVAKNKAFLNPECLHRYGHLYTDYHTKFYWWECSELLRKLLLSAVIALVASGSSLQIIAGLFVAVAFHVFHAMCNPFIDKMYGWLQHGFLAIIWLSLLVGLVLKLNKLEAAAIGDESSNTGPGVIVLILYISILGVAAGIIGMKIQYYLKSRKTKNAAFVKQEALDRKHDALDKGMVSPMDGERRPGHRAKQGSIGLDSMVFARAAHPSLGDDELVEWARENGSLLASIKHDPDGGASVLASLRTRDGGSDLRSILDNRRKVAPITTDSDSIVSSRPTYATGTRGHKNAPSDSNVWLGGAGVSPAAPHDHTALSILPESQPRLGSIPGEVSSDEEDSSSDSESENYRREVEKSDVVGSEPPKFPRGPSIKSPRRKRTFDIAEEGSHNSQRSITRLMAELNGIEEPSSDAEHDGSRRGLDRNTSISRQMFHLMTGGDDLPPHGGSRTQAEHDRLIAHLNSGEDKDFIVRSVTQIEREKIAEDDARRQAELDKKLAKKARKAAKRARHEGRRRSVEEADAIAAAEAASADAASTPTFMSPIEAVAKDEPPVMVAYQPGQWGSSFATGGLSSTRASIPMHSRGPSIGVGLASTRARPLQPLQGMGPAPKANISIYHQATNNNLLSAPPLHVRTPSVQSTPPAALPPSAATLAPVSGFFPPRIGASVTGPGGHRPAPSTSMHFNPLDPDSARFVFLPPPIPIQNITPTITTSTSNSPPAPSTSISPAATKSNSQSITPPVSTSSSILPPSKTNIRAATASVPPVSSPSPGSVGSGVEDPNMETIPLDQPIRQEEASTLTPERRPITNETSASPVHPQSRPGVNLVLSLTAPVAPHPLSPQPSSGGVDESEDDDDPLEDDEHDSDLDEFMNAGKVNMLNKKR